MRAPSGSLQGLLRGFIGAILTWMAPGPGLALEVGVAKVDISPQTPVRLSGYGGRRTESEGVAQRLWAKAVALGSDAEGAALLMTVDNCGISGSMADEVAERLQRAAGIPRERIAICSTHTHSGPCLTGVLPNLFSQDIAPEQQATIDRYTRELVDRLERVARAALADRRAGKLEWAQGSVDFAQNRRTPGGPVDHALPVLKIMAADGTLRGLVANYACHCTTLGGDYNQFHGDWAGCAQEYLERDHPGAVALITIGCGGDANPQPRNKAEHARQHGEAVAREVNRLLGQTFVPLESKLSCAARRIELPFQTHFTRAQWEQRATQSGIVGYHAKKNLARLDRGEPLPTQLPYFVQSWSFGRDLALVFLAGEVVIDYTLRIKTEFDPARLWVSGYANGVPCYIPSQRILREGGYEAEDSLWYYDRPARLAPESEDRILAAVRDLVPAGFRWSSEKAEFPPPQSPAEALASFRTRAEMQIELVAAEPLVIDPVAIDFGADGKLWVAEMHDYPMGVDGKWKPGGRVKFLEDTDGDGKYDKATMLLDGLPFPTGLMAWKKGVLICAAPDILYAEDTNGDGRADVVTKLLSGFATHNYQARVNGLRWGLDHWVYGSSGLFGGHIQVARTGQEVDLSGRDFRFQPDTGELEPAHGLSQQPRVRDDWGEWFGCDNSTLLWHYPLPDAYVRRNPHVTAPEPRVFPPRETDPNRLFPSSRTLTRFNDFNNFNRVTSGCGVEIYRDELLGAAFVGNSFTCEPVHNLVHRLTLRPEGVTFSARRSPDEERSEFLSSTDNWFRPVEARTGPDGALWIVDMYRFVIEHPRWIPPERLAKLDPRAGSDKGRIYRVFPRGQTLRPLRNLQKLDSSELVAVLGIPNGPQRDLAHRELLLRDDRAALPALAALAASSPIPAGRAQALCVLEGLHALTPALLEQRLADPEPLVRRQVVRLSEPFLSGSPALAAAIVKLVTDPDVRVRYQLALSLGAWNDRRAAEALGRIAQTALGDPWMRAAVLSSSTRHPDAVLEPMLRSGSADSEVQAFAGQLIATAVATGNREALASIWKGLNAVPVGLDPGFRMNTLASLLDAFERARLNWETYSQPGAPEGLGMVAQIREQLGAARSLVTDDKAPEGARLAAIPLLAREPDRAEADLQVLVDLAMTGAGRVQSGSLDHLRRQRSPRVPVLLLANWNRHSPSLRTAIAGLLLNREEWSGALLGALEKGTVGPGEISPANRQRLLQHENRSLQKRTEALFAAHRSESRDRVLAKYANVPVLIGDPARGSGVFEKTCASCHFLRGQGHAVGPNLAEFQNKSAQDFVVAILDPNAALEAKFVNYLVETKDGRSLSGIVRGESGTTLTLVQGGGAEERILRGDIVEMKASALSLMPEGLEQSLSPQDIADLIAFVRTQTPAVFGSADPEQAAKARAGFFSAGPSHLARLVKASERLDYPSWLGRWPLVHCRQTDGRSTVTWQTSPVPVGADPRMRFRFPAALGLKSESSAKFELKVNGRSALEFDVTLRDETWQSGDGKVRMTYTVMENNTEDSNGLLVIEVARDLVEAGQPVTFEVTGGAAHSGRWFGLYLVSETARASVTP